VVNIKVFVVTLCSLVERYYFCLYNEDSRFADILVTLLQGQTKVITFHLATLRNIVLLTIRMRMVMAV